MSTLELVTTEDLIKELERRFEVFIIAARKNMTGTIHVKVLEYKDTDYMVAVGLLEELKFEILSDVCFDDDTSDGMPD